MPAAEGGPEVRLSPCCVQAPHCLECVTGQGLPLTEAHEESRAGAALGSAHS